MVGSLEYQSTKIGVHIRRNEALDQMSYQNYCLLILYSQLAEDCKINFKKYFKSKALHESLIYKHGDNRFVFQASVLASTI